MTPLEPRFNEPANGRSPSGSSRRQGADEPIEVRRYVDAVRRGRWLILTLALSAALVAYILSSLAPDRYTATATIVKRVTVGVAESVNVDSLARELSTIGQLLVTTDVLDRAAEQVGDGETATRPVALGQVEGRPRGEPDLHQRHGATTRGRRRGSPTRSPTRSSRSRPTSRASSTRRARQGLLQQLRTLRSSDPGAEQQEQAIRQRLSDIGVAQAAAGIDLRIAAARRRPARAHVAEAAAQRGHRALPRPLHRRPDRARPRPARAARQRRPRAQPPARPADARRHPVRPAPARPRPRRADRDGVRELPDARRVDPLLAPRRGGPARACSSPARPPRRGQDHGDRAARRARSRRRATARCSSPPTCAGRRCTRSWASTRSRA